LRILGVPRFAFVDAVLVAHGETIIRGTLEDEALEPCRDRHHEPAIRFEDELPKTIPAGTSKEAWSPVIVARDAHDDVELGGNTPKSDEGRIGCGAPLVADGQCFLRQRNSKIDVGF